MKLRQQSEENLRMSNLVNTKEILLMDKMEKIRLDQTKLLKLKDDQMNRTCGFQKQQSRQRKRNQDKEGANELPFYERLREKSNILEAQARKDEVAQKEIMQYHAAYVGGKCLINTSNISDISKIDEMRAKKEAAERQKKADDLKNQILAKKQKAESVCRQQNLDGVQQKMSSSIRSTVREKQMKFKQAIEDPDNREVTVFATIKLPEILSGMEDKDFRKQVKMKQHQYKQQLEQVQKMGDGKFLGMSEQEILLNQH